MARYNSQIRYAKVTHGQPNANLSDASYRNDWFNYNKSSSVDGISRPSGSAQSFFWTKPGTKPHLMRPWTFTGHDFNLNIPDCAYINKITFTVMVRVTGKITVAAPQGRFNFYHGSKAVPNNFKNDTGWKDGYYYQKPNKNLSASWQAIDYVLTGDEFRRRGYPISELRETRMGIDLRWYYPTKIKANHDIQIQYISVKVDYELPDQYLTFDTVTNEDTPYMAKSGEEFKVVARYYNRSNAGCCGDVNRKVKVNLPPNTKVRALNGSFDSSTNEWSVRCIPNASQSLTLAVKDYGIGEKNIFFSNDDVHGTFWYYSMPVDNDVGEVTPYPDTYMQEGVVSCVTFKSVVNASDGEATFNINMDKANNTNPAVKWSIVEDETDTNITLNESKSTDNKAVFNVPRNEVVNLTFKGCFIPRFTGETSVTVDLDGRPVPPAEAEYTVLDAPVFKVTNEAKTKETDRETAEIVLNPSVINFITHRIASETELGAYIIECGVTDFDRTMIEKECTLTADTWDQVDYIGVVPLEYHHYDPDSTYSNKAISEAYKNKTYKGKEGVIEENIGLKFKARPWQVPTLQGLTKLDKPTPINANHKCFEGDPLNHRGWAVLSEIKTKRTNPLWYDVEAEVDYITHDIHTKFQIFRELQVNDKQMPDLTADVFSLGDNLSDGLDIFDVDTDGGFIYDEDGEEGARNIFSLDEGQHFYLKTRKSVTDVANIRFDWYSNRINEFRENNMERVFRLVDGSGESVLEYEYTNFQFSNEYVTCSVIVRIKTVDGWQTLTYDGIDLRTEIEADPIIDTDGEVIIDDTDIDDEETTEDDDDDEEVEPAYEEGYIAPEFDLNTYNVTQIYGTSLLFHLKGNTLQIVDEGYNGREFTSDSIELVSSNYFFEVEWKNRNKDGTTEDIISYMDLSLSETILNTDYADKYRNLLVSPFPIPYKTVVFTRDSEEGTIYYLTGEEPFKYLLEPYYQYHCGCDLLGDRTSIFDLDNSYTYYYIENGLVRLGFNKYNGRLYLAKYDIQSDEWITTHYFHLVNEPKFAVETYSDDKIVIKAGNDTFFTIWRGRPFIGIKNPTDTIYIDSNFSYGFADNVEDVNLPYPQIYSFMNTWNLLPSGIGGNYLDSDEIDIDDDYEEIITTDHDITLTIPSDIKSNAEITFTPTVTPAPSSGEVHLFVDGTDVGEATSPFTLPHTFTKEGMYKVFAVYIGDNDKDNIAFSPVYDVEVKAPELHNDPKPEIQGNYNLSIVSAPSKFTYRDNQKVVLQLKKGTTPLNHFPIETVEPDGTTDTVYTNSAGQYSIVNSQVAFVPGNHQWGARFYDPTDTDHDGKLVCTALKWIKIEKATPKFTHNAVNNKVSKNHYITFKFNGVDALRDPSNKGVADMSVSYSVDGGKKVSTKTNKNGNFSIKMTTKKTHKIKVIFAGSVRYNAVTKTFTVKVV